jgi:CubicO group peptidase (beta-lactamase class C family)
MDAQERTQRLIDDLVATGQETGVQVAAYLHGERVVHAWAGPADSSTPVDGGTLFNSWSAAKGVTSTIVHVLAEAGLLGYDVPIAHYWPEFGAHGKGAILLAHLLTHTAGVPYAPAGLTPADLGDWHGMCARIADLRPRSEPGAVTAYHPVTFGYIAGEVVRRVTGRTIAEVLRDEVAGPLGVAGDLFFGVPAEQLSRVARLEEGNWARLMAARPAGSPFFEAIPPALLPSPALGNARDYLTVHNPASGTMTADALARMYAALIGDVGGVRLIGAERMATVSAPATREHDGVLGGPIVKCLGYFLGLPETGGAPGAFGFRGSGGSAAFADPARDFSFAFTHNRLTGPPVDNAVLVADEVRAALFG